MSSFAIFRASLLTVFIRAGRVGLSLFALSLVLEVLAPIPTALASAKVPPARKQIDSNVIGFQFISDTQGFVLGFDHNLWLVHAPFGNVPPGRTLVDRNVSFFRAIDATQVLVLGTDEKLWLVHAPFGNVPPGRTSLGGLLNRNLSSFQPLSTTEFLLVDQSIVLDLDLTLRPPYPRIDSNARSFRDFAGHLLVLENNGNLRLTERPFGNSFRQVDANVSDYQFIDAHIYVQATNGDLWLESEPFGTSNRIQVDARVSRFQALSSTEVVVLGTNGNLWLEFAPFG